MANHQQRTDRFTAAEDQYVGYTVRDRNGEKIGKVDDLFLDAKDQPEYIGVKTGFFGTSGALIPMDIATVDQSQGFIEVSQPKSHVKDGPAFDDDGEITPEYENEVRSYYGLSAPDGPVRPGGHGNSNEKHEGSEGLDTSYHGGPHGGNDTREGFDTSYHGGDHDPSRSPESRESHGGEEPHDEEGFDTSYHSGDDDSRRSSERRTGGEGRRDR